MQNNRLLLWAIFGFLAFMIYSKWQLANAPVPPPQPIDTAQVAPTVSSVNDGSVPVVGTPGIAAVSSVNNITVKTDVFSISISPVGGNIVDVKLLAFPESLEDKDVPFALLSSDPAHLFISQSGLAAAEGQLMFVHDLQGFAAEKDQYELGDADTLVVPVTYTDPETGSTLTKSYEFKRGSYDIGFTQKFVNNTGANWTGKNYMLLAQKDPKVSGRMVGASSYIGSVYAMGDESYKKVAFDKLKTDSPAITKDGQRGWVAMIQQYYTTAWLALENLPHTVNVMKLPGDVSMIRLMAANAVNVPAGGSHEFKNSLYIGPKVKKGMVEASQFTDEEGKTGSVKLDLTLDYGWFSPISALMLVVLEFFYGFVGNWGWSIVLLTLTVKLVLYPLSEKGYRSMAKMRHLGPQMELIKQQYGSDRQKVGQETMALYRREKVNPMGGCWPMLIQIPIFISLFWMLQESVQLRQAPWIFWIHDLSVMDPYFVLPVLMCATMFVQQMFNPPPPDPMQAKIMKFMPLVFGFMFLWFASGIVIYWVMNNLLTILQQWIINRRLEAAQKKIA